MFIMLRILTTACTLAGIKRVQFISMRNRLGWQEKVQIHHIIPKEFRTHPVLLDFDINDGQNLMFLPNPLGRSTLSTRRPNHDGGHHAYNQYVGTLLDRLTLTKSEGELDVLIRRLRQSLRHEPDVPWK